jgi:hypothetical protein
MHLTLIIKVLDIIQQCKIPLIMLNISQKPLIMLSIAKNHNKMQLNKNKNMHDFLTGKGVLFLPCPQ